MKSGGSGGSAIRIHPDRFPHPYPRAQDAPQPSWAFVYADVRPRNDRACLISSSHAEPTAVPFPNKGLQLESNGKHPGHPCAQSLRRTLGAKHLLTLQTLRRFEDDFASGPPHLSSPACAVPNVRAPVPSLAIHRPPCSHRSHEPLTAVFYPPNSVPPPDGRPLDWTRIFRTSSAPYTIVFDQLVSPPAGAGVSSPLKTADVACDESLQLRAGVPVHWLHCPSVESGNTRLRQRGMAAPCVGARGA